MTGALTTSGLFAAPPPSQQQRPSVFRGGAIIVPIDLRVVDRLGQPITTLKASDITVLEDGVRQGDKVVVEGLQRIQEGMTVAAKPAPAAATPPGAPAASQPAPGAK